MSYVILRSTVNWGDFGPKRLLCPTVAILIKYTQTLKYCSFNTFGYIESFIQHISNVITLIHKFEYILSKLLLWDKATS